MKLIMKKELQPNTEPTYRIEEYDPKTKEEEVLQQIKPPVTCR
ncbi:hypothetical protein Hdeb2414_s0022g00611851 [Helianthus debilis subsp. tardiflorus]